jgi:hypothetical protein
VTTSTVRPTTPEFFPPILQEDLDSARKWRTAYSFYSQRLTVRGQCLGIAVVVLSAVTGTAIFASIGESPATWSKVTVGAASVLAVVLSSVQTYMNYPRRAAAADRARVGYQELYDDLRHLKEQYEGGDPADGRRLALLDRRMRTLTEQSPTLSDRVWDCAQHRHRRARAKVTRTRADAS